MACDQSDSDAYLLIMLRAREIRLGVGAAMRGHSHDGYAAQKKLARWCNAFVVEDDDIRGPTTRCRSERGASAIHRFCPEIDAQARSPTSSARGVVAGSQPFYRAGDKGIMLD